MNLPIIRLEVEGMRHSICRALSEYALQIDEQMQGAVKEYCTPENLGKIIRTEADRVLTDVIKTEVDNYFRFGKGREAVRKAVQDSLLKNEFDISL